MNTSSIQRNSIFYNKGNCFRFGRNSNPSKENLLHFRRNCLVNTIVFKLDPKKLCEAESNKLTLYKYLSQIRKEKSTINNNKQIPNLNNDYDYDYNISNQNLNFKKKKKQTKREMELLRKKKNKKKEKQKQKQKSQRTNFLLEDQYLYSMKYENFDSHHISSITKWGDYLRGRINKIASFEYLNHNDLFFLKFQRIIRSEDKSLPSGKSNINELNVLRHYNDNIVHTISKKRFIKSNNAKASNDKYSKPQIHLDRQKELLITLLANEKKFKQSKSNADIIIEEFKDYNGEDNRVNDNKVTNLSLCSQRTKKWMNKSTKNIEKTIETDMSKINERIMSYSLKADSRFSLKKIIEFWISNCNMLTEKKGKKFEDKYPLYGDDSEDKTKINKKKRKEIIRHIYTTPSEDILNIIPFCSKKYTILTKNH